jgi:23S rRNA pseudouridine2605 synthase
MEKERIQKVLARCGLASRREIERWIEQGRITVNGKNAHLGQSIGVGDKVIVDGKPVKKLYEDEPLRIILYNKPEGEIVTRNDPEGRPTVFERLPRLDNGRWVNVGRLDINTTGLLLFTNSGDCAHRLMHPSLHLQREYAVRVYGDVTPEMTKKLVNGVQLEDGWARFEDVLAAEEGRSNRWFNVVVMEGRNRIVRRLWESQDCQISRLKRVRFGDVMLPRNLRVGRWVELTGAIKLTLAGQATSVRTA